MQTKTKMIITVVTILILTVIVGGYYFQQKNKFATKDSQINMPFLEAEKIPEEVKASLPERSDYGSNLPIEFPSDIPIEKDAVVNQSYGLTYEGQKQLSIVFLSNKKTKENFALYADFLEKQNWIISNKYESENVSSLYGSKEKNEINVTISESTPAKSQVSIGIFKK